MDSIEIAKCVTVQSQKFTITRWKDPDRATARSAECGAVLLNAIYTRTLRRDL